MELSTTVAEGAVLVALEGNVLEEAGSGAVSLTFGARVAPLTLSLGAGATVSGLVAREPSTVRAGATGGVVGAGGVEREMTAAPLTSVVSAAPSPISTIRRLRRASSATRLLTESSIRSAVDSPAGGGALRVPIRTVRIAVRSARGGSDLPASACASAAANSDIEA